MSGYNSIFRHCLQLAAGLTLMKRRKLNPEGESFETTKTVKTMAKSTFDNLPREVWHEIASHLEPSDKAALTLTCKSSLTCFCTEVVRNLNLPSRRMERLKLLFRLHYQFPKHYLCVECCVYHLTINQMTYEAADLTLEGCIATPTLKWADISAVATDLRAAKCTADDVQKRLGPGISVALKDDRLLMSFACLFPMTVRMLQMGSHKSLTWFTCIHVSKSSSILKEVEKAIAAAPRPWESAQGYNYESPIFRCPYCPTEYGIWSSTIKEAALVPQTGARYQLILVRITDLGRLSSPHDRYWAALTRPRDFRVIETEPYDIGGPDGIAKRYMEVKGWKPSADGPVLPLLDDMPNETVPPITSHNPRKV